MTTTQCLTITNEVTWYYTDLSTIKFAKTYLTEQDNLVFDTSLATKDTDYKSYFQAVCQALRVKTLSRHIDVTQVE